MNRAVRAMPLRRQRRGFSLLDETTLRLNLSYVLHEHSASRAVTDIAEACERHANHMAGLDATPLPIVPEPSRAVEGIELWLTVTLGLPATTVQTLSATGASVLFADVHAGTPTTEQTFCRAPAHLSLPSDTPLQVGIGAVILRPGATSARLITEGPFAWSTERFAAIRALERLVQSYTDQWMPRSPLWPAPAETLLGPDEIWLPK